MTRKYDFRHFNHNTPLSEIKEAIKTILLGEFEDPIPYIQMLKALEPFNGKRWTKRILEQLKQTYPNAGMWTDQRQNFGLFWWLDGKQASLSLNLSEQKKNVTLNMDEVRRLNAHVTTEAHERNLKRARITQDDTWLHILATTCKQVFKIAIEIGDACAEIPNFITVLEAMDIAPATRMRKFS